MSAFVPMLLMTTASGACIFAGGMLARVERIRPRWLEQELRHTIIAFGGGVLLAAVAFVLVPEGQEYFPSPGGGVAIFLAGGVVFMLVERYLAAKRHQLPQTMAMLLDFIPESLAMGGMFALGSPSAPLLALLIGSVQPASAQCAELPGCVLVWSDEFDGVGLDATNWSYDIGTGCPSLCGWGNNELQWYLEDSAELRDGKLVITAREESVSGKNYTSARINTQDRFAFKYGRIEARIKLPAGQGLWPALWMLSQDSDYLCGGEPCVWAATGEIDIVEAVNLDGTGGKANLDNLSVTEASTASRQQIDGQRTVLVDRLGIVRDEDGPSQCLFYQGAYAGVPGNAAGKDDIPLG